jgi:CcmD family protein
VTLAETVDITTIKYVAAVYGLVWIVTLAYVVILNSKLGRLERQLDDIVGTLERRKAGDDA